MSRRSADVLDDHSTPNEAFYFSDAGDANEEEVFFSQQIGKIKEC